MWAIIQTPYEEAAHHLRVLTTLWGVVLRGTVLQL